MSIPGKIYSLIKKGYKKFIQQYPGIEKIVVPIHVGIINHPAYTRWQIGRARKTYLNMIEESWNSSESQAFAHPLSPKITFLLPGEATNDDFLTTLHSIEQQRYANYEIICCGLNRELPIEGTRPSGTLVQTKGIITTIYADMFSETQGDFVIFAQPGDVFHVDYLNWLVECHNEYPDAEIIYADGYSRERDGSIVMPFFNPESWSPTLMLSNNMLTRSMVAVGLARENIKMTKDICSLTLQEWALMLACGSSASAVRHTTQVGFSTLVEKAMYGMVEMEKVIQDHLMGRGLPGVQVRRNKGFNQVTWKSRQPKVSIIIPSKDKFSVLHQAIESVFSKTDYPGYEIIIVDNLSTQPEVLKYYRELEAAGKARVVPYAETFNYSRAINIGARYAQGELLCLLNNDIEVIEPGWLSELARWALLPEVGVVGAKLLFPNQSIQHAGIIIGMDGFVGHLYMHVPEDYFGLMGSVDWYRDLSAVTGACQLISRAVFERLGGYNEEYQLTFSDVEFCLRARENGLAVLYTPHACLYHWEGKTRGRNTPLSDITKARKAYIVSSDILDPYFSKQLSRQKIPIVASND